MYELEYDPIKLKELLGDWNSNFKWGTRLVSPPSTAYTFTTEDLIDSTMPTDTMIQINFGYFSFQINETNPNSRDGNLNNMEFRRTSLP